MNAQTKGLMTPEALISYPHLFTAQEGMSGGEPKFSASFIFTEEQTKTPEFAALKDAAATVISEKWGANIPSNVRSPFREDGASKGYPENCVFLGAKSKHQPGLVDWNLEPLSSGDVYPGAVVRARVSCFAYDVNGNRGVAFGLDAVQKLRDGDRLDGRVDAKNAFTATAPPVAVDFSDIDQAAARGATPAVNELGALLS